MASSTPLTDVAPNSPSITSPVTGPTRPSIAFVLVTMLAGAVLASTAFGGVLYYLARSGKLSMRKDTASKSVPHVDAPTHLLALDPLLVNLADEGESTYMKLSITLQVEDSIVAKDSAAKSNKNGDDVIAAVRDTALTVLGQQTADDLLAPYGKEHLKAELLKAFNEQNPGIKVKKILFTDFLVQR